MEHMVKCPSWQVSHRGCKQWAGPMSLHNGEFPTLRSEEPGHFYPPGPTWQCPRLGGEAPFEIASRGRCEDAGIRIQGAGEPRYEGHHAARVTGASQLGP